MSHDPIPKEFFSYESQRLFEYCIECEKYLLDEGTEYLIEKAVKNYPGFEARDVVFDYAICMDCANNLRKEISKESWANMMRYFKDHLDERIADAGGEQSHPGISQCMIKNIKIDQCHEYQLFAHCNGKKLNMTNPPYMLSGEVMEDLLPLLSDQTIDEMNGFFRKHFSPDPSLFEPTPSLILV